MDGPNLRSCATFTTFAIVLTSGAGRSARRSSAAPSGGRGVRSRRAPVP